MFNKLLIADSGKGHVEEMIRMLQDIPSMRSAAMALLHVIPEQSKAGADSHRIDAEELLDSAINRMGLERSRVTPLVREGDTKQTVLKVAEEQNCDLIVMGSRGLGRLQSILANSASQYVFQLSTRPMLLVRDDLYVRHVNRVMVTIDGTGVGDDALRSACEKSQRPEWALELSKAMQRSGVMPDVITYTALIRAREKSQRPERAPGLS